MTAPAPLIPGDVDLRDFEFMPLDVRRFRDSALIATRDAEEIVAATLLWCASWHQVPASSLPDDERELAVLAGYGRAIKEFRRVREGAMHRLVHCSDGRFYHPVVAEKAADAWNGKLNDQWRRAIDRVRKENVQRTETRQEPLPIPPRPSLLIRQNQGDIPTFVYAVSAGILAPRRGKSSVKGEGEGKGQRKGEGKGPGLPPSASSPENPNHAPLALLPDPPERRTAATWEAYSRAHAERYGVAPIRNAKVNGMLARFVDRVGVEDAPHVAAWFIASKRGLYTSAKHPVDLLLRDAEGLRTEWATRTHGTDTAARLGDRQAATGNAFAKLITEAEGNGD